MANGNDLELLGVPLLPEDVLRMPVYDHAGAVVAPPVPAPVAGVTFGEPTVTYPPARPVSGPEELAVNVPLADALKMQAQQQAQQQAQGAGAFDAMAGAMAPDPAVERVREMLSGTLTGIPGVTMGPAAARTTGKVKRTTVDTGTVDEPGMWPSAGPPPKVSPGRRVLALAGRQRSMTRAIPRAQEEQEIDDLNQRISGLEGETNKVLKARSKELGAAYDQFLYGADIHGPAGREERVAAEETRKSKADARLRAASADVTKRMRELVKKERDPRRWWKRQSGFAKAMYVISGILETIGAGVSGGKHKVMIGKVVDDAVAQDLALQEREIATELQGLQAEGAKITEMRRWETQKRKDFVVQEQMRYLSFKTGLDKIAKKWEGTIGGLAAQKASAMIMLKAAERRALGLATQLRQQDIMKAARVGGYGAGAFKAWKKKMEGTRKLTPAETARLQSKWNTFGSMQQLYGMFMKEAKESKLPGPIAPISSWVKFTQAGVMKRQTMALAMRLAVDWSGGRATDEENKRAADALMSKWDTPASGWNIMKYLVDQAAHDMQGWVATIPGADENARKAIRNVGRPVWEMQKLLKIIGDKMGYSSNTSIGDAVKSVHRQMTRIKKLREQRLIAAGKAR
jgi:hypothetical protein